MLWEVNNSYWACDHKRVQTFPLSSASLIYHPPIAISYKHQCSFFNLYHCAKVEVYWPQEIKEYFRILLGSGWYYNESRFNSQKTRTLSANTHVCLCSWRAASTELVFSYRLQHRKRREGSCSHNIGQLNKNVKTTIFNANLATFQACAMHSPNKSTDNNHYSIEDNSNIDHPVVLSLNGKKYLRACTEKFSLTDACLTTKGNSKVMQVQRLTLNT